MLASTKYMCSNCLTVDNRRRCCDWSTYICASLLRLKSIVGSSRNTRLGKIPALQCVWKHIAISLVPNYPGLERGQSISRRLGFGTVSAPFSCLVFFIDSLFFFQAILDIPRSLTSTRTPILALLLGLRHEYQDLASNFVSPTLLTSLIMLSF